MQRVSFIWVFALALGLFSSNASAQSRRARPDCGSAPFVIRNVRVFDGEGIVHSTDVFVRDTLITAIGPRLTVPRGTRSCEASGFTLMPGLIDGHTHINHGSNLAEALLFGITTELDMFANLDTLAVIRKAGLANTGSSWADFRTAGTLVTTAGGHGTQFGFVIPTLQSPDSAQQFIDHRLAEGSNYIKVVYDNGSEWGFIGPMLDSATMVAAIAAARKRNVLSIVHIGSYRGAVTALEAGADGIAHVFADSMPDANFGALVAAHNAFVITTLTPVGQLSADSSWGVDRMLRDTAVFSRLDAGQDSSLNERFNPPERAHMQVAREVVRQLRAANVRVIAGSDSPAPGTAHGITLHLELRNMVRAGFTPIEALRAATSVPARIFGLADRGRIKAGLRSDLLLLSGDPTMNINATFRIARVWKRGRSVDRSYRQMFAGGGKPASTLKDAKWRSLTDLASGGSSTVSLTAIPEGAQGPKHALRVTGRVRPSISAAFAGVTFRPVQKVMGPPPFFGFRGVEFWTRGDGGSYQIAVEMRDGTVTTQSFFRPKSQWAPIRITFASMGVTAPAGIIGIRITPASSIVRNFRFEIGQARLW